ATSVSWYVERRLRARFTHERATASGRGSELRIDSEAGQGASVSMEPRAKRARSLHSTERGSWNVSPGEGRLTFRLECEHSLGSRCGGSDTRKRALVRSRTRCFPSARMEP